jgi:hypothetical protein
MKETRYGLCHDGHVPSIASFIQVLSNPGTLQRVAIALKDVHVIPHPLLNKYREECCRETKGESHEPKRIHTDIGWRWTESGERRWQCGRND